MIKNLLNLEADRDLAGLGEVAENVVRDIER